MEHKPGMCASSNSIVKQRHLVQLGSAADPFDAVMYDAHAL